MDTMKRFGFAALLVIGATLCASARAQTFQLENTGVEPSAAGRATLAKVTFLGEYTSGNRLGTEGHTTVLYSGQLTVNCQGLTPRATYRIIGFNKTVKAGQDGTLQAQSTNWDFGYQDGWYFDHNSGRYVDYFYYPTVQVLRVNPDGSQTLVLHVELPYPP
jgi:hypothetical protein